MERHKVFADFLNDVINDKSGDNKEFDDIESL